MHILTRHIPTLETFLIAAENHFKDIGKEYNEDDIVEVAHLMAQGAIILLDMQMKKEKDKQCVVQQQHIIS